MHIDFNEYDCNDCLFFHEAGMDSAALTEINPSLLRESLVPQDLSSETKSPQNSEKLLDSNHEILSAFETHDLKLNLFLVDMLNEEAEHQGGRKGSGFTQSSRHLAEFIRKPRSSSDIGLFDTEVRANIEDGLYDKYRDTNEPDEAWRESVIDRGIDSIADNLQFEESKLLAGLIADIVKPKEKISITKLPAVGERLNIGTCTTAEYYFFNYLNNRNAIGNVGEMNIILDRDGTPLMLEKIGYGEDHSCLTLKSTIINGVEIPPGSLVGVQRPDEIERRALSDGSGNTINLEDCQGFEFLRLTTLAISPENRQRAFGNHYTFQSENRMSGYDTSTIEDFTLKATRLTLSST